MIEINYDYFQIIEIMIIEINYFAVINKIIEINYDFSDIFSKTKETLSRI